MNLGCIIRILQQKQAAGARAIDVKDSALRAYNDWILAEREHFSWGVDSCNSYYRTPGGHTPFLFPGDFAHPFGNTIPSGTPLGLLRATKWE